MDLIVCFSCNKVFDTDADNIRSDYIDVCPMDTADARYEIGYNCTHCGYFNVRSYSEEAPTNSKVGDLYPLTFIL